MTTPSQPGWYFMSIPRDQSVRFYIQKTLDASNLDVSLICVPLNNDISRNIHENEMTDVSLGNFIKTLNYHDGPVENYGVFNVNDWGKLSIFDYDTKLPTDISSIPCWVLLRNKVVPSLVIDTSLVTLKEYNYDLAISDISYTTSQENTRATKEYYVNKIYLKFPETTQLQKISYGGNIQPLNGLSNENIVYESVIHNDVLYGENDKKSYFHYLWFDNYKYSKEFYRETDFDTSLNGYSYGVGIYSYPFYHIRNKEFQGLMSDNNDLDYVKYDQNKMINHSDFDSYLTLGDASYGKITEPNVLVENVYDNSWIISDFQNYVWEEHLYNDFSNLLESAGREKPSIINWTDVSLTHKPVRWGPANRKEHLVTKDISFEILQLILDKSSTGSIELSYGNDLDNQIYYQKLYVNEGEISMNLVRHIPAGLVINVSTGAVYLKGPIPRAAGAIPTEKTFVQELEFNWFSAASYTTNGAGFKIGTKYFGNSNSELIGEHAVTDNLIDNMKAFNNSLSPSPPSDPFKVIIENPDDINNVINNSKLKSKNDGNSVSANDESDNVRKIQRPEKSVDGDTNGTIKNNRIFYNLKFSGIENSFIGNSGMGASESSADTVCQANKELILFSFKLNISNIDFMLKYPPNQVYMKIAYVNGGTDPNGNVIDENRGNSYLNELKLSEYIFTPDTLPPQRYDDNNEVIGDLDITNESGFFPLTIIQDL